MRPLIWAMAVVAMGVGPVRFRVMAYNVQNLFDAEKDPGKDDGHYLPKGHPQKKKNSSLNWTKKKMAIKIDQLAKVVSQAQAPAMLAVVEVENPKALGALAQRLAYPNFVITQGPDPRGIDVALLYRPKDLAGAAKVFHRQHVFHQTRPILEVAFQWPKEERLHVFVNHWPSQRSPTKARSLGARALARRLREIRRQTPRAHILALGDFNTLATELPWPLGELLSGPGPLLVDIGPPQGPPGTYFYPPSMSWNHLDRILVSPSLVDGKSLEADPETLTIYAPLFVTKTYLYKRKSSHFYGSKINGVPRSYSHTAAMPSRAGFSDHFPIFVDLYLKQ